MKQITKKSFIALTGLMVFANINLATAQTVNMSRYIELTVTPGSEIELAFLAAADNTAIKVVSGTSETTLTVGTDWTGYQNYTASANTMRVYGDIIGFDCGENYEKLTGLDISQNTALEVLGCYDNRLEKLDISQNTALKYLVCDGNNFTTQAIDELYCSLPLRQPADNAVIYPVYEPSSSNHATVLATNAQNAIDKNWKVSYEADDTAVPTTGTYKCGTGVETVGGNIVAKVYPNPVNDALRIECEQAIERLELYDAMGRCILHKKNTPGTTTIDVSKLKKGFYLLRLHTNNGSGKYNKVVKE